MKECVVCGKMIKKVDSVMTIDYVCSLACKTERKKTVPKRVSITSKSYWIDQGYTEEVAIAKVSELQAQRSPRHPSYWTTRGFTEKEATDKVSEIQKGNNQKRNEKYTHEERQAFTPLSTVYWVNRGYSDEEALEIIRTNGNTVSLESHIRRHGEVAGTILYNEYCETMKFVNSLAGFVERYGESEGERVWLGKFANRGNSKSAENFFTELTANIPVNFKIHTASNDNGEYGIQNTEVGQYYFYDYVIPKLGVCVEFHGDYWHCNPEKYTAEYYNTLTGKTASEHWAYDQLKIDTMTKYRGYETTVVWESEAKAKLPEVITMINERYAIVKAESPHLFEEEVSLEEPVSKNDT